MRPLVVMDTNVAAVANRMAEQAQDRCVEECIKALEDIRSSRRIVLDEDGDILDEYLKIIRDWSGRVGDVFLKEIFDNQANEARCVKVALASHDKRRYVEFPDDPDLTGFDQDDRKFVAVSCAIGTNPPILNASDTDWWHYRHALKRNGIRVKHLCPELMRSGTRMSSER